MIACGSVKEGEDVAHLTQVRNQLAIRDSGDGDVRDVLQVTTENLVVVACCFLDAAGYVWRDRLCCPGGQVLLSALQYFLWRTMAAALESLTIVSL